MNNNIPTDCVIVKLKDGFEVATIQTFHITKGVEKTCPLDIFKVSTNLDLVSNPHDLKVDDAAVATKTTEIDAGENEAAADTLSSDSFETAKKADSADSEEKENKMDLMKSFKGKSSGKHTSKKKK